MVSQTLRLAETLLQATGNIKFKEVLLRPSEEHLAGEENLLFFKL